MAGRPGGQLERALVGLTIGMRNGERARADALRSSRSGEYFQQVQVAISGQASNVWGSADVKVSWEHPFVYSPLQRDIQFATPQVSHHIEFAGTLSDLVLAHAHVIAWNETAHGWLIGATARVATCAPNAAAAVAVPYAGVLHITFQAYAYPTDEELDT